MRVLRARAHTLMYSRWCMHADQILKGSQSLTNEANGVSCRRAARLKEQGVSEEDAEKDEEESAERRKERRRLKKEKKAAAAQRCVLSRSSMCQRAHAESLSHRDRCV